MRRLVCFCTLPLTNCFYLFDVILLLCHRQGHSSATYSKEVFFQKHRRMSRKGCSCLCILVIKKRKRVVFMTSCSFRNGIRHFLFLEIRPSQRRQDISKIQTLGYFGFLTKRHFYYFILWNWVWNLWMWVFRTWSLSIRRPWTGLNLRNGGFFSHWGWKPYRNVLLLHCTLCNNP